MQNLQKEKKEVKCVVWDLDNTIWHGVLIEDKNVKLKPGIIDVLGELDSRGILHSIASKNNYDDAMEKLEEFKIKDYFLYPEIHWEIKSKSIMNIQKNLNFHMDTITFIDDQPFERDEVKSVHPVIETFDAVEYKKILDYKRFNPRFITSDSKKRRKMYQDDIKRKIEESDFEGPSDEFLSTLNMTFIISEAKEEDLKRAEELTVRTNQLNATGLTYSYDELNKFRKSDNHKLLICELIDKYGSYGKIGLSLIELKEDVWHLKLLLMSCRVMARGVGSVLMSYIMNQAKEDNKKLLANFKKTDRNRQMLITYKFANFKEVEAKEDGFILFENDLSIIQPYPSYIYLKLPVSLQLKS